MSIVLKRCSIIDGVNFPACDKTYNVYIDKTRIKYITPSNVNIDFKADLHLECKGRILMPGMIDTHVHFRTPGHGHKETFLSGSMGAVAGGVTSVFDMPNTDPIINSALALDNKIDLIGKVKCNYGIYATVTDEGHLYHLDNHIHCSGIKLYFGSTFGDIVSDTDLIYRVLDKSQNKIVTFHAECPKTISANLHKFNPNIYKNHTNIRDKYACIRATEELLKIADKLQRNIVIAHVSTPEEVDLIYDCKFAFCEVALHHLVLDSETVYDKCGCLGVVNPSIKSREDREKMLERLDKIDFIGSDHAPHTYKEKQQGMPGINGVQTSFPLLLDICSSLEHISRVTSYNQAKLFTLHNKAQIKEGYDADLVVINPNSPFIINSGIIKSKQTHTPFEGIKCNNSIEFTIVNGELVYQFGQVLKCNPGAPLSFDVY